MRFDLLIQNLRKGTRYIDLEKRLENNRATFTFYPPFWRMFNYQLRGVTFNWSFLEFKSNLDPIVPDNTPGIYLFVLRPPFNVFIEYNHVMYVGMSDEGLKERLNSGYRTPSGVKSRPHVMRMILDYGEYLRWYYLPLPGLTEKRLREIETALIGYFCDPPINRKDQPVLIANASKSKLSI